MDQLDILDLFYAVPVGDLAMRVSSAKLAQVSSSDWSALTVILAAIVLSWIGLHRRGATAADESHERAPISQTDFRSLQFIQILEILVVSTFFAMGLFLKLPTEGDQAVLYPGEDWLVGLLFFVFILYLAWDLIAVHLAGSAAWRNPARVGTFVTMKFLALVGITFMAVLIVHPRTAVMVILLNAWLVVMLYAYRVSQDFWGNTYSRG